MASERERDLALTMAGESEEMLLEAWSGSMLVLSMAYDLAMDWALTTAIVMAKGLSVDV